MHLNPYSVRLRNGQPWLLSSIPGMRMPWIISPQIISNISDLSGSVKNCLPSLPRYGSWLTLIPSALALIRPTDSSRFPYWFQPSPRKAWNRNPRASSVRMNRILAGLWMFFGHEAYKREGLGQYRRSHLLSKPAATRAFCPQSCDCGLVNRAICGVTISAT
jgi:hypothetical protein